jgi:hypothetical protein
MNLSKNQKQRLAWIVVAVVYTVVALTLGVTYPIPLPPDDELVALGVTHHSGMEISGSETDALVVNQTSTGDVVEFRDAGTVVWRLADGGAVTQPGDGAIGDAAGDTLTIVGDVVMTGYRDATTGYDRFFQLDGVATGTLASAKTRAMEITLERTAGYEITVGDLQDTGLMVRVETEAVTTTAGTVLRAVDAEAKADNPSGTVTNLYGGLFTSKSDTSAGSVGTMVALSANTQNNAAVDDYLAAADFRIMRQAATVPTEEYVVEIRSSSTTGTGADAAIFVNSDYASSATTDSFDYGIDFNSAAINTADVRFENGTTLSEATDKILTFSEFLGGAEQTAEVVTSGSTIVPTGSWQPISSASSVTCSTSTCITAGTQDGQLLILQNVNASDTITIDGAGGNVECKSDVVLGTMDTIMLVWNGSDWYCISSYDNS